MQDPAASQENVQPLPDALQDIRAKFDALKSQYSALVKIMQTSLVDASQRTSPLPFTPEEDSRLDQASQMTSPPPRSSYRNSMATTASGSLAEWFDAEDDGPQEFVMDLGHEMSEPGSRLLPPDEESNPDNDRSSEDTDFEEPERVASPIQEPTPSPFGSALVTRRTQLPCLPPSDEGSLFAILKKNVGKVRLLSIRGAAESTCFKGPFNYHIPRYFQ